MIPRNTIPTSEDGDVFDEAADSQTEVEVHRAAGRAAAGGADPHRWRQGLKLAGIPPAPARGIPQIEVTFDIDANGGFERDRPRDEADGQATRASRSHSSSGLSKDEVEKMAKEAESHAAEDKEKREEIDARNFSSTGLVYNIEKMLKDKAAEVGAGG